MPAFLYLLLIGKLCYCESFTSIELFEPSNYDFELPTANVSSKIAEPNAKSVSSDQHYNTTIHTRREDAKYNSDFSTEALDITNITNGFDTSGIFNENITLFSNDTQLKDNGKIMMQVNNTLELLNNATELNNSVNAAIFINNTNTNGTDSKNDTEDKTILNGSHSAIITSLSNTCPEEEEPTNIGPYEVPSQQDVILHIRSHLLAMYSGFHKKAMTFLKDIKEATQASWSSKMFCQGPAELMHYRRCVRWVGDLAVLTTKSLVTALETMRQDVATLIQGKICNISSLNIDPIHLIRILAAERVSLEFALPDFLRQLHACSRLCPGTRGIHPAQYLKTARLTNQDFVLRHYYTQQNYNQQLNRQYKI